MKTTTIMAVAIVLLAMHGAPMSQALAQQPHATALHAESLQAKFVIENVDVRIEPETITIRGTVMSDEDRLHVEHMFRAFWPDGNVHNLLAIRHPEER